MDYRKTMLFTLVVFCNVAKWIAAIIGGFGICFNLYAILYTWHEYNTNPMCIGSVYPNGDFRFKNFNFSISPLINQTITIKIEKIVGSEKKLFEANIEVRCDNWDAAVSKTVKYAGYVLLYSFTCAGAVLWHYHYLSAKKDYEKYIRKHRQDRKAVSASLLDKKDKKTAMADIPVVKVV